MPKKTRPYEDDLIQSLKDPKEAAAYLNVHLEDEDENSNELFLLALRDVAIAYGMADIASQTSLGRESLYKSLSPDGNPKLQTLKTILKSMGLRLAVEEEKHAVQHAALIKN